MNFVIAQKKYYRSILWGTEKSKLLRNGLLMLLGSLLIALSAKIIIPLQPVAITLQSLAVIFLGMTLGWRLGGAAVLLYLVEGFVGLPVFTVGFLAPQLGYLIGFLFAAILSGYLAECGWGKHFMTTIVAAGMATILILSCGYFVLSQFIGYGAAFLTGVKPFLLGDALKIIFLSCVVPTFWRVERSFIS